MLYLEAPAGVGYSFCVDPESTCTSNDTSAAIDNHDFLVGFLQAFPEYAKRPMFITGESYAGIYIPTLMQQVAKQGVITNIEGVAIGNGCCECALPMANPIPNKSLIELECLLVVGGTVAGTNCGDVGGNPGTVYKIDAEYYLGRGLISPQLKAAADNACGTDWTDPLGPQCKAAWANISIALGPFVSQSLLCQYTAGRLRMHPSLWTLCLLCRT